MSGVDEADRVEESVSDALRKASSKKVARAARAAQGLAAHPPYPVNDQEFMLSLARGLAVITTFSEQQRSLTMAEISGHTGLPRAVVRRCLHTLKHLGYVTSFQKQFSLRPKVLTLGHAYLTSAPLATLCQPYLEKMTSALHESCSMAVLEGDQITYIARSASLFRIMSVDLQIGSSLPAYCTSMGRVLLAQQEPEALADTLSRTKLLSHTRYTITDPANLRTILTVCKARGYCLVDQELELGLRSIAVPVFNMAGNAVAALNVGVNAGRYTKQQLKALALSVLKAISAEIRQLLL